MANITPSTIPHLSVKPLLKNNIFNAFRKFMKNSTTKNGCAIFVYISAMLLQRSALIKAHCCRRQNNVNLFPGSLV